MLEDVGEEVYRLDRLLTQLLRRGWFDGVRGIVLGRRSPTAASPAAVRDLVATGWRRSACRCCWGRRSATSARNLAFPLGVPAVLDADAGTLVLREAALL